MQLLKPEGDTKPVNGVQKLLNAPVNLGRLGCDPERLYLDPRTQVNADPTGSGSTSFLVGTVRLSPKYAAWIDIVFQYSTL